MHRILSVSGVLFLSFTDVVAAQIDSVEISREAELYLLEALDSIESVMLGRDTIAWATVRDSAFLRAWGARVPTDTYGAIQWVLQRANEHSFLQASTPGASASVIDSRFGYVYVPQRGGAALALADSLQDNVRALLEADVCGWIVDLRANGGGNMWPMLAGVGPLLGDTLIGGFGAGRAVDRWYYRDGVSGILHSDGTVDTVTQITVEPLPLIDRTVAVAVLINGGTGSSGEAVAVAFLARPNVRFFGTPTAGFATVNRGSRLSDGANLVVTTGYYADREGVVQPKFLVPDEEVVGSVGRWPFPTDRVGRAAINWLLAQQSCRPRPD